MHACVAYGLQIHSTLPLPELASGGTGADAVICVGKVEQAPAEEQSARPRGWVRCDQAFLSWPEAGAFWVKEGREITIEPAPGVEECVLRQYLLGPVLAVLLHQRGRLILHASAVAFDGGAVAFLGESGGGKSTTAAAFHAQGHPVVTDDVMAVQAGSDSPLVFPGFPQLKLWPEAALSLGDAPEALPRLHPDEEKRGRSVAGRFAGSPLPLQSIYLLADGPTLRIEAVPALEGVIELVRHSYGIRLLHSVNATSHFQQCVSLARTVPIQRLRRPRSLPQLPELVELVEADRGHQRSV